MSTIFITEPQSKLYLVVVFPTTALRAWNTMDCSQPAAWTSKRRLLVVSRVKVLSGRQTNPTRPYPELRTWKAAVFSVAEAVSPALHLRLVSFGRGIELNPRPPCCSYSMPIRCDATSIVCSTCQRHFHRTCSRLTQSQKGIQGFVCYFLFRKCCCTTFYNLRRPPPVQAHCHNDAYSATQRFDTASVPSCVNSVPTSHKGSALAYPVVRSTPPGCALYALYQLPPSLHNP